MCGSHLLKFLDSHVGHKKGGEMTINLRRRRVPYKKQNINYYDKKTKAKINEIKNYSREAPQERNPRRYPCEQRICTF